MAAGGELERNIARPTLETDLDDRAEGSRWIANLSASALSATRSGTRWLMPTRAAAQVKSVPPRAPGNSGCGAVPSLVPKPINIACHMYWPKVAENNKCTGSVTVNLQHVDG
jgi:hypothetical protein